jgi:hypothetical protein
MCAGSSLNLQIPPGYSSPVWSTGETTVSVSIQQSGTYWANALSPENCRVSDTVYVLFGACQTTLNQPVKKAIKHRIAVYPNPVEDILFLQAPGNIEPRQAFLFFLNGQKMRVELEPINLSTWQLPVDKLQPGMYQLLLITSNEKLVVRFIKK